MKKKKKNGKENKKKVPGSIPAAKLNGVYSGPGSILNPSFIEIFPVVVVVWPCWQTNQPTNKQTNRHGWMHKFLGGGK